MSINENVVRSRSKRLNDFVWYFVIAFGLIGLALYALFTGVSWDIFMRWFGLIGLTSVVFGFSISESRSLWEVRSFWGLLGSIFVVHCIVCVNLALAGVNLSGFKLMIACIVELCVLNILKHLIYRDRTGTTTK